MRGRPPERPPSAAVLQTIFEMRRIEIPTRCPIFFTPKPTESRQDRPSLTTSSATRRRHVGASSPGCSLPEIEWDPYPIRLKGAGMLLNGSLPERPSKGAGILKPETPARPYTCIHRPLIVFLLTTAEKNSPSTATSFAVIPATLESIFSSEDLP